jgi:hypothetical protein
MQSHEKNNTEPVLEGRRKSYYCTPEVNGTSYIFFSLFAIQRPQHRMATTTTQQ